MKYTLKKIDPVSAGKIQAAIMAVMVGIFAIPVGLIMILSQKSGPGLALMIGAPLVYGIMGFIAGAIGSFIYNLAAKQVGGMELELEQ